MKHYHVYRTPEGVRCDVWTHDNEPPKPLEHVEFHSPGGFEYGYGGSGPADLALSILAHFFGEDPGETLKQIRGWSDVDGPPASWRFHQHVKRALLAGRHDGESAEVRLHGMPVEALEEWAATDDPEERRSAALKAKRGFWINEAMLAAAIGEYSVEGLQLMRRSMRETGVGVDKRGRLVAVEPLEHPGDE